MTKKKEPLVSIVIPVFNAAKYLPDTIKTIQDQTYQNWEAIFVDDNSNDGSLGILLEAKSQDDRIRILGSTKNSGAAISRNRGVAVSKGRYLCFLDADDLWKPEKIEKQVHFMQDKGCAFSFTGYEFADESGKPNGKKVNVPDSMTYEDALKNTTISTITVMFDMNRLSKSDIEMPNIHCEDTATWWRVLRLPGMKAYGMRYISAIYRRIPSSSSANKLKAAFWAFNLYKGYSGLNFINVIKYYSCYCLNAVRRRI